DGSGSSDPDGDALTFAWTLTSAPTGSGATLMNINGASATLTPDLPGTYVVSLVVSDSLASSVADTVVVTATGVQAPPAISGFSPTSGRAGDIVAGTGSNFVGVQSVSFNGAAALGYTVIGSTS